jgi:hypothetical protein
MLIFKSLIFFSGVFDTLVVVSLPDVFGHNSDYFPDNPD